MLSHSTWFLSDKADKELGMKVVFLTNFKNTQP